MSLHEDMIQDRSEDIEDTQPESGVMSGEASSHASGKRQISRKILLLAAVAAVTIVVIIVKTGNVTDNVNNSVTNDVPKIEYNIAVFADAGTETIVMPYAVKFPTYLPEGLTLTSASFNNAANINSFRTTFNGRPDGSFDLQFYVEFGRESSLSATGSRIFVGKDRVAINSSDIFLFGCNMIMMQWNENGNSYVITGTLDMDAMRRVAMLIINSQPTYLEIAVGTAALRSTSAPQLPPTTPATTTTTLEGDEAMPYAAKWPTYLPEGMKMTTARATFESGKFRAFFAAFNEKADGSYDLNFQMNVTTLTTIPGTNHEITLGGNKIKARAAIGVGGLKVNRLEWIDNGTYYLLMGSPDIETLTKIAESIK